MRLVYTDKFNKQYRQTTETIRTACDKQLRLLLDNFRHPSLQTKLYLAAEGLWQGRVNQSWRFYFTIDGDAYTLVAVTKHPK